MTEEFEEINETAMLNIINDLEPRGKFLYKHSNTVFVGCDNNLGHANVEEFKTKLECIQWLNAHTMSETFEDAVNHSTKIHDLTIQIIEEVGCIVSKEEKIAALNYVLETLTEELEISK